MTMVAEDDLIDAVVESVVVVKPVAVKAVLTSYRQAPVAPPVNKTEEKNKKAKTT